ncbi:MAG: 5'-nucleotidase C-terminal domain-containing protein [Dehalococcoidia bacterium]
MPQIRAPPGRGSWWSSSIWSIAESEAIARAVDGIDVIVGNHEDQPLAQPVLVGGAIIARSPADYKGLGELTLRLADGRPTGFEYVEHKVTKDSPQDEAVAAIVARYQDDLKARLQAPVGRADTARRPHGDGARQGVEPRQLHRRRAARLGQRADVALMNGGGIRGNKEYGPGVLTREDVVSILPFKHARPCSASPAPACSPRWRTASAAAAPPRRPPACPAASPRPAACASRSIRSVRPGRGCSPWRWAARRSTRRACTCWRRTTSWRTAATATMRSRGGGRHLRPGGAARRAHRGHRARRRRRPAAEGAHHLRSGRGRGEFDLPRSTLSGPRPAPFDDRRRRRTGAVAR